MIVIVGTLLTTSVLIGSLSAQPRRPRITGVAHIALFVHNMEKSRAYYKDLLGFGEPCSLDKPEGGLAMTFIKVNDRQYIELYPEVRPGSDRLNHIAVETDDVDAMRAYLASKGVTVPGKPTLDRIKNLSFTVKDPDGNGVEFVQYMPDGWSMREKGKCMPAERVSTKINHVGIIVSDLDRAMKFYHDVLGFQEFWRGSRDGKVLNWVNVRVPDGDTWIEFMLYGEPPAPTARGVSHVGLEVPDLNKTKAWLEARPAAKDYIRSLGIRAKLAEMAIRLWAAEPMARRTAGLILSDERLKSIEEYSAFGVNRSRQINLFDPDGTRSELMGPVQHAPSSTAPPPASGHAKK